MQTLGMSLRLPSFFEPLKSYSRFSTICPEVRCLEVSFHGRLQNIRSSRQSKSADFQRLNTEVSLPVFSRSLLMYSVCQKFMNHFFKISIKKLSSSKVSSKAFFRDIRRNSVEIVNAFKSSHFSLKYLVQFYKTSSSVHFIFLSTISNFHYSSTSNSPTFQHKFPLKVLKLLSTTAQFSTQQLPI
jgi:hypothetical protein